eukprot:4466654-Pleurochrysis_carterae.AAC.1
MLAHARARARCERASALARSHGCLFPLQRALSRSDSLSLFHSPRLSFHAGEQRGRDEGSVLRARRDRHPRRRARGAHPGKSRPPRMFAAILTDWR